MYKLDIKRVAEKDIDRLSPSMAHRITDAATELKREPRPRGVKKLAEDISVGDHRIIYTINGHKITFSKENCRAGCPTYDICFSNPYGELLARQDFSDTLSKM